ncbi:hypothetical protein TSAR_008106 [Trichomalopsis sarcophagae]|uniref:Uncharacterized protein n=1 Tax=Trichomalopsis sarcophagae TaxID=543379 RepID=A0A232EU74_9HYME|nr:hypothetical protein TSAR_008106 [Trichomalopsis sarcophagae]
MDGKVIERELQDLYFVPELNANLFSIPMINARKYSFHSKTSTAKPVSNRKAKERSTYCHIMEISPSEEDDVSETLHIAENVSEERICCAMTSVQPAINPMGDKRQVDKNHGILTQADDPEREPQISASRESKIDQLVTIWSQPF